MVKCDDQNSNCHKSCELQCSGGEALVTPSWALQAAGETDSSSDEQHDVSDDAGQSSRNDIPHEHETIFENDSDTDYDFDAVRKSHPDYDFLRHDRQQTREEVAMLTASTKYIACTRFLITLNGVGCGYRNSTMAQTCAFTGFVSRFGATHATRKPPKANSSHCPVAGSSNPLSSSGCAHHRLYLRICGVYE